MQTKQEVAARAKVYYEANKEVVAARQKAYYEANKEVVAAKKKVWWAANKEQRAAYYEANKQAIVAQKKVYYEANKEVIAAQKKAYNEAHKEERAAYHKVWYEANKEQLRAKHKVYDESRKEERSAWQRARRAERNRMLFNYKGAKCCHCGLHEPNHLEIYDYHHVDPATKLYGIARILSGPLERLMTEADKCLLLCAHCHRKEHARLTKEKYAE